MDDFDKELDMVRRDPNDLNKHVQVIMNDLIWYFQSKKSFKEV